MASPDTCQTLEKLEIKRHRVLPILVELISPEIARAYREEQPEDEDEMTDNGSGEDLGLVHRGVVCVRNLFANLYAKEDRKTMSLEADSRGLVRALVQTIKSNTGGTENGAVLKAAAED
ncbi:hypothetical protein JB92DRAFT_3247511 [Gautieria morchelliformis]|nr:hypothetical protein JB92DRAFT_3247511 [Gautieria morchelliformis]